MSSADSSPSRSPGKLSVAVPKANCPDHRWPTGLSGRTQRVAGQIFPSCNRWIREASMAETLERLHNIGLESRAMSEALAEDTSLADESVATKAKSKPCGSSEREEWMAKWHSDLSWYRAMYEDLEGKNSPSNPQSDTASSTPVVPSIGPASKIIHKFNPDGYAGSPTAKEGHQPIASQDSYRIPVTSRPPPPWSMLHQTGQAPPSVSSAVKTESPPAVPPFHGTSLPTPLPPVSPPHRYSSSTEQHQAQGGPTGPSSSTHCCGCDAHAGSTPAGNCSECAILRQDLEHLRSTVDDQQVVLDCLVTEIGFLQAGRYPALYPHTPHSPWRNPYPNPWAYSYSPTVHPPHMGPARPPPFPLRHLPNGDRVGPAPAAYPVPTGGTTHQEREAPSFKAPTVTAPKPPPNTPAQTSPVTKDQRFHGSSGRGNSSPKRVSFACPMTAGEVDSDDSSEDTLVPKVGLDPKSPLSVKTGKGLQPKKAGAALKKSSPNSSSRSKPYPIADAFKHRPAVYSSKSPRSFYGAVLPEKESLRYWGHVAGSPADAAEEGPPDGERAPRLSSSTTLPFVMPGQDARDTDTQSKELQVRFDATTMFQFMQYWQPHVDPSQPLLVEMSLDAATYEDFLKWGVGNGYFRT